MQSITKLGVRIRCLAPISKYLQSIDVMKAQTGFRSIPKSICMEHKPDCYLGEITPGTFGAQWLGTMGFRHELTSWDTTAITVRDTGVLGLGGTLELLPTNAMGNKLDVECLTTGFEQWLVLLDKNAFQSPAYGAFSLEICEVSG